MTKQDEQTNQQSETNPGPEFGIQRIYTKDISFEAPSTPQIFRVEWKPVVAVDLHTKSAVLEADTHEVVLIITVTAKIDETVAFLAEIQQAGIFTLKGFSEEQLRHMLVGSYCPNILFPYAREVISDLITRGGFPSLYLAPINFDAIYQQHLQAEQQKAEGETAH